MASDDDFGPVLKGGPRSGPVARPRARGAAAEGGQARPRPAPRGRPDDGFGPPERGRGSRRRTRRRRRRGGFGRTFLVLLLILALLLVGAPLALAAYASAQIDREPVEGLSATSGLRMNILVVGSDSREGLTDEEVLELGTGRVEGKRADTLMILAVRGTQAAMLSLPRDLWVTRCDGASSRVNAAYAVSRGCLVETVNAHTGIPITHYVELDFLSFVRLVDAVGTVEVCTDEPLFDVAAALDIPAGCSDLSGSEALGFVRARQIDDDFGRQGRQQYFIQQLANEIASPSTLANPVRLVNTAGAAGSTLIADERFGTFDLIRLGVGARGLAGAPTFTVPVTPQTIGGAAVLVPREGEAQQLYTQFRDNAIFDMRPEEPEGEA